MSHNHIVTLCDKDVYASSNPKSSTPSVVQFSSMARFVETGTEFFLNVALTSIETL